jgi:hypothetical protein
MEFEEITCPLCKSPYDSDQKLPRLLFKCGHSICQECLKAKLDMIRNFEDFNKFLTENAENSDKSEKIENSEKSNNLLKNENLQKISENFTCPEDNISYSEFTNIDSFPKNVTLLKLITKKEKFKTIKISQPFESESNILKTPPNELKSPSNTNINDNHLHLDHITKDKEKNHSSSSLRSSHGTFQHHNTINSIRSSIKKQTTIHEKEKEKEFNIATTEPNTNTLINSNLFTTNFNVKFCTLHPTRPLEIICIDDKIKICTNCALFGEHKNHKIMNEEDFMKEIEIKAEILIELFELIDSNVNDFKNTDSNNNFSQIYQNLLKKAEDKQNAMILQVRNFTEELIKNIQKKQENILEKINSKFEKIRNKITAIKETPTDLLKSSEIWKEQVQEKLDYLSLVTEGNNLYEEGYVKLIETNITDENIIKTAESILQEFVKVKSFPLETIEKMVEENRIEIDYDLANKLDSVIKLSKDGDMSMSLSNNQSDNLPTANRVTSPMSNEEDFLILDEEDKKRINKKSLEVMMSNNHTNNNSIFTTVETEMSTVNNIGFGNIQNICEINNNNSFLNLSEDSALIRIGDLREKKDAKDISCSPKELSLSNPSSVILNNQVTSPRNKIPVKSTFSSNQNNSHVNTIKLPLGPRKDKSRSPIKYSQSSTTPDKDKVVFIKNQFKNEIANFTGVGKKIKKIFKKSKIFHFLDIGEDGVRIVIDLLNNSNPTNKSNIFSFNSTNQQNPPTTINNKVKELKLTKTNLTDEQLTSLLKALESNQQINNLNVAKNNLTDKSIDAIVSLFKKNNTLKTIYLSNNNFSTNGKDKLKSYAGGVKNIKIFI